MTMEFLSDVKLSEEAQNQKFFDILDWSVNYRPKSRKTWFLEMQLLGMLTSRNFEGLSLLTSEINPENFRSISQRLTILQNNLKNGAKCWTVKCRTGPIKYELSHMTSPNLLGDVMSPISRHWPSFKSLTQTHICIRRLVYSKLTSKWLFAE